MSLEQQLITQLNALQPAHLQVINESSGHGGYFPGKESHFKVVIVSECFAGLRLVQRHQKVYQENLEFAKENRHNTILFFHQY